MFRSVVVGSRVGGPLVSKFSRTGVGDILDIEDSCLYKANREPLGIELDIKFDFVVCFERDHQLVREGEEEGAVKLAGFNSVRGEADIGGEEVVSAISDIRFRGIRVVVRGKRTDGGGRRSHVDTC